MRNAYKIAGLGLLLGSAVTLAAVPASARGPMGDSFGGFGGPGGFSTTAFTEFDLSGDGQITEDDLVARAEARLAKVDADGNGLISAEELAASVQAQIEARIADQTMRAPRRMDAETIATRVAARMIGIRDADDDGALSLDELAPRYGYGRMIDRFDTDDDNAISEAEYDAAKQEMQDRIARRGDRGGWGDRGGNWGQGPRGNTGGRW